MERSLRFQPHPSPPPSRSSSAHTNGIPPRGAFSSLMSMRQEPTSLLGSPTSRSSAPPSSVLSSPRSGFEYPPDYHQVPPETVKRSPVKRLPKRGFGSVPSVSSSPPPPPPPSRLRQARAGSNSASVVRPMRRPTATQAHPAESGNNNSSLPGTRAHSSSQISPRGVRKALDPGTQQQQQQQARASIKKGIPGGDSPIGINISTNSNNLIGNEDDVHPIDTLAKKLRQQALELTGVYEQLEKKTQRLKDQETQIQELQFQLENLKCVKQQSSKTVNSRSNTKTMTMAGTTRRASAVHSGGKSSNGTRQSVPGGSKPPSGGSGTTSAAAAAKKIEELQQQVRDLEYEKKQHELSTERIESAIAELRLHQNGRMQQHLADGENTLDPRNLEDPSTHTPEVLLQEQQLYIRVLEEAVHLKASELHVTGHEELLMVLAELRHTIYQQEQDVAEKQRQVDIMKTQLLEKSEKQLTQSQQLDAKSTQRELEIYKLRQEKSTLANRLDQVQRQLQREKEQNQRLQASIKDFKEREAHLNEKVTSGLQLKKLAESKVDKLTRLLQETQSYLAQMTSKYEHEARKSSRLSDDFTTKASQVEELNVLQDELLCKIDSYASKSEAATLEKANLEAQLQSTLTREQSRAKQLQELVSTKEGDLRSLSARLEAAELLANETNRRLDTMAKQKLALEKQIEDERLQMEKTLDDQSMVLNEEKRAIEEGEKLWNGMQEILKELNAAIRASLEMMTMDSGSQRTYNVDNVDNTVDLTNETSVGLQELMLCVRSLSHLMTSESVSDNQFQNHLPSFQDLVRRVHRVIASSVEDLMSKHDAWTHERTDLRNANEKLHATTQMCELEMRKVHKQHLGACEQLEEVSMELAARNHETMGLKTIRQELHSEIESLRAFEQQLAEQNRVVTDQELRIEALIGKLQAREASETKQKAALEEKKQLISQLHEELLEAKERAMQLEHVKSAFENAVELTEQQNARSEELLLKLQEHELLKCDQEESIEAFKAKEKAFSDRFRGLFRQYYEHLRASSSVFHPRGKRLSQREGDAEIVERLNMYESEEQRGDVVRMVQIFPTLLEDFMICSNTATPKEVAYDEAIKPKKLHAERNNYFRGFPVKPNARSDQKVSTEVNKASSHNHRPQRPTATAARAAGTSSALIQSIPTHDDCAAATKPSGDMSASLTKRSVGAVTNAVQSTPDLKQQPSYRYGSEEHLQQQQQQPTRSFFHRAAAAHRTPAISATTMHAEDACFQEQLELIRDAFQTFKAPKQAPHFER